MRQELDHLIHTSSSFRKTVTQTVSPVPSISLSDIHRGPLQGHRSLQKNWGHTGRVRRTNFGEPMFSYLYVSAGDRTQLSALTNLTHEAISPTLNFQFLKLPPNCTLLGPTLETESADLGLVLCMEHRLPGRPRSPGWGGICAWGVERA